MICNPPSGGGTHIADRLREELDGFGPDREVETRDAGDVPWAAGEWRNGLLFVAGASVSSASKACALPIGQHK